MFCIFVCQDASLVNGTRNILKKAELLSGNASTNKGNDCLASLSIPHLSLMAILEYTYAKTVLIFNLAPMNFWNVFLCMICCLSFYFSDIWRATHFNQGKHFGFLQLHLLTFFRVYIDCLDTWILVFLHVSYRSLIQANQNRRPALQPTFPWRRKRRGWWRMYRLAHFLSRPRLPSPLRAFYSRLPWACQASSLSPSLHALQTPSSGPGRSELVNMATLLLLYWSTTPCCFYLVILYSSFFKNNFGIFFFFLSSPVPALISLRFPPLTSSPRLSRAASSPSAPRLVPLQPWPPSRTPSAPKRHCTMCPTSGKIIVLFDVICMPVFFLLSCFAW